MPQAAGEGWLYAFFGPNYGLAPRAHNCMLWLNQSVRCYDSYASVFVF